MSSSLQWLKTALVFGSCLLIGACVQVPNTQADVASTPSAPSGADGSCKSPQGWVREGTISYRCTLPAQYIQQCPQYFCRRCTSGTWGAEYSCTLRY
jgi:hypothetical protein